MYHAGWIICFAVAAAFFYAISWLLPPQVLPESLPGAGPLKFEELADAEGYLDGEVVITFSKHQDEKAVASSEV